MHLLVKVLALLAWSIVGVANGSDIDRDGVPNDIDNCLEVPNPDQTNTDASEDAFGNRCDPDFDNNGRVDFADLALLKESFFGTNPLTDLDGNGRTDFADLAILKSMFFGPPGPGASAEARKFNVGHYTAMLPANDGDQAILDSVKPGVVGILKRYDWRQLEPSLGQYDFSEIESDLALVASQGLQLIVKIVDKTFKVNGIPTPDYLSSDQYIRVNRFGGYTAVRWNPYVIERMQALIAELGQRFDPDPNFEGIAIQESAPSLDDPELDATDYTPEKYRDALIAVLTNGMQSLPCSRIFWFQNFLPRNNGYLDDVATAVQSLGVTMGGPDALPDDEPLQLLVFPRYDKFNGKMPLFTQVEPAVYRHLHEDTTFPTKYWTMQEIFEFARDDLHVNYVIWTRLIEPKPDDSYSWLDALPVIEANPVFNP